MGRGSSAGADDRLSVILATYNGAPYLEAQLDSLRRQTRLPDELIVIDDASTDATPAILEAFAADAPFPVDLVLRPEHLGTWTTFEEGLRLATGDILLVCDQDDIWLPEKLEVMAERMAEQPDALMAFSDAYLISAAGRRIGRSRWRVAGYSAHQERATVLDPFGPLLSHQAVSGCTMAIRAELLDALLPFPTDIHAGLPVMMYDRWISLIAAAAGPVIPVPERLIDYRIHPGQQIGIPALRVRRFLPRTALHGAQLLHRRAEVLRRLDYHLAHFDEIEKRLIVARLDTSESSARLAAARRHLRLREGLDPRRRVRVWAVTEELRRPDGYRRYSLGVASALADVAR